MFDSGGCGCFMFAFVVCGLGISLLFGLLDLFVLFADMVAVLSLLAWRLLFCYCVFFGCVGFGASCLLWWCCCLCLLFGLCGSICDLGVVMFGGFAWL